MVATLKQVVLVIAMLAAGGCLSMPAGRAGGCALLDGWAPAFDARLQEPRVSGDTGGCYLEGFSSSRQVVEQQVKLIEAMIGDACGDSRTRASFAPATRGGLAGHAFTVAVSGDRDVGMCKPVDVPDASGLDAATGPSSRYLTPPKYPADAIRQGIEGQTVLVVLVETSGDVGAAIVETSSGHPELDEAAVATALEWRFHPKLQDARPVRSFVRVPVDFLL